MRQALWVLMVADLVTLGYCGASLADTWFSQHLGESKLERQTETVSVDRVDKGDAIGRIEISRLGISAVIMEGSGETVLRRGVGHIPGTAFRGRSGNVGLAAHRDTFFRGLRYVRRNDDVILRTPRGEYQYRVLSTKNIAPKAVEEFQTYPCCMSSQPGPSAGEHPKSPRRCVSENRCWANGCLFPAGSHLSCWESC